MSSENVKAVTEAAFEEETKEGVCLVDFWADWCGPCLMIAPAVDAIADKMAGRVKVLKVHVDEQPGLANKFNIRGIPTLKILKNGKEVDELVGVRPAADIEEKLEARLAE
ncbi:MAG: thioredoxin [Planctomycetes bacterium]|nr:thioredoxin [Planctomycetota bacterium]